MNKSFGKYAMINPVKHVFELETDWYWWIEPATANAELEIQKVFAQERFKVLEDGSKIQMYVTTLEVAITEIAVTFGGTNIPTSETDPSPILKKGASLEEIKEVLKEMPREMLLELWGAVGDAVPGLGPAKPRKPKTEEEGSDETKNS